MPMFIPKAKRSLPVQLKAGPSRPPPTATSGQPKSRAASSGSPRPPKPTPPTESVTAEPKPAPDEPYEDFKIFTPSATDLASGRKYNLFRFESRKPINPTYWPRPVKLNRKDPSRPDDDDELGNVKLTPMLGLDGKPVIGADGIMVMLGPDGRPALQHARPKPADQPQTSKKKPFQRKTRQVYTIPEAVRQLRKEEKVPWVLEDSTGDEVWVARLDELSKADNHGFLIPREAEAGAFVFYPSHRFYKFAKKSKRKHMALEEAEEELARIAKGRPTPAWLRKGVKQEPKTTSLGPGGRRLKIVDSGQKTKFQQDDEFSSAALAKQRAREMGREGDADEMEYESDFADDDEGGHMDAMDEDEAKELEERIKKEYRTAERLENASDEDEDLRQLSGAGKDMKKLFKRLDKGAMEEDSDKEENPYKSSEEEESEEDEPMEIGPQIQPQQINKNADGAQITQAQAQAQAQGQPPPQAQTQPQPQPQPQSQPPRPPSKAPTPSLPPSQIATGSRATSPILLGSDTPGYGASLIAKRATSPKVPRPRPGSPNRSRATSPLATAGGSRATSPGRSSSAVNSRAGSPGASGHTNINGKRRAEEQDGVAATNAPSPTSPTGGAPNGRVPKKPRLGPKGSAQGPLTEEMIIEWINQTEDPTSKECIHRFRSYIKEDSAKAAFTAMIKKLVTLKDGKMVLKPPYAGGSGTSPSTPAA